MARTRPLFAFKLTLKVLLLFASSAWAQIDVGDYTISGSGEIGGLPRTFKGDKAAFETYRDIPETVVVPQLQLMIGGKKEDFYFNFDSYKTGLNDQQYTLRTGRYGLLDMEFQWDQIPHWFSNDIARTPYAVNDGHTTLFTLASKPATSTATSSCTNPLTMCSWLNNNAQPINLNLYNGIARFNLRYTPTPGWTFTGSYWQNHNVGSRAFGTLFGTSPGSYNITELAEPIDYQTYNIELGTEYAGNGWTVGVKYNGSIFNNLHSSIVWDNPMNVTGVGGACVDGALNYALGTGSCRGRLDLYPNNQAHSFTITGSANLPYKSNFMGTVSYGYMLQNAKFLPFTINSSIAEPTISRNSLGGDVRPLMVNTTLVNNFFDKINFKAFYRYYGLDNHSSQISMPGGFVNLDSVLVPGAIQNDIFSYSKNSVGFEANYNFVRWLSAKLAYGYERMHRVDREVFNQDKFTFGPTVDIKPSSQLLLRASYRHLWGNDSPYIAAPDAEPTNSLRKFDEAATRRDKLSLFAQYTPLDNLMLYWGFEYNYDKYLYATLGTQYDDNISPSVGANFTPLPWLRLFTNFNWDRYDWRLNAIQRDGNIANENPANCSVSGNPAFGRCWNSRGVDRISTVSVGSDMDLIEKILGLRLQFTYSNGNSLVFASGSTCAGCTPATNYPPVKNQWYEFLARFEYNVQKNIALRFGYYYNHATEKDFGVDIMKPFMGDVDTSASAQRSMFLGDQVKGPFTANVGFVTMAFKF